MDGQERVFDSFRETIEVREPRLVYKLLRYVGPDTLLYSLFDFEETFRRLWSRYIGEDHA